VGERERERGFELGTMTDRERKTVIKNEKEERERR
jgi:hypothetical protein